MLIVMIDDSSEKNDQDQVVFSKSQPSESDSDKILPLDQLVLPVVPIREGVLFPSTESVLTFGRDLSLNAINQAAESDSKYVV